ncbi:hypothetical protein E2320_011777, partial [Naja naja]
MVVHHADVFLDLFGRDSFWEGGPELSHLASGKSGVECGGKFRTDELRNRALKGWDGGSNLASISKTEEFGGGLLHRLELVEKWMGSTKAQLVKM